MIRNLILAAVAALALAFSSPASAQVSSSSSVLAANQVVKGTGGLLYGIQISADGTLSGAAWWVMVYDATAAPSNGTVTPRKCYAMASGATELSRSFSPPIQFGLGIVVGVSTTGCFTKTESVHAFISGDFQ